MKRLLHWWSRQKTGQDKDVLPTTEPLTVIPEGLQSRFSETDILDPSPKNDPSQQLFSIFIRQGRHYIQIVTTEDRIFDHDRIRSELNGSYEILGPNEEKELLGPYGLVRGPGFSIQNDIPLWMDAVVLTVQDPRVTLKQYRSWVAIRPEILQSEIKAAAKITSLSHSRPGLSEVFKDKGLNSGVVLSASRVFIYQRLRTELEIPALGTTVQKLLRMRTDPAANVDRLVRIIKDDPPMAAMVLKLGNSPLYARSNQSADLRDIVVRVLGHDLTLNFLLGYALSNTMAAPKREPDRPLGYWAEALFVAELSRRLAVQSKRDVDPHTAYLSGLLHNFGYRVLAHVFPMQFDQLCDEWTLNRHVDPIFIEDKVLHVTQDDIAAVLLSKWSIPAPIVVGVQAQNRLGYHGEYSAYACLIRLARRCLSLDGWLNERVSLDGRCFIQTGLDRQTLKLTYRELVSDIDRYCELNTLL